MLCPVVSCRNILTLSPSAALSIRNRSQCGASKNRGLHIAHCAFTELIFSLALSRRGSEMVIETSLYTNEIAVAHDHKLIQSNICHIERAGTLRALDEKLIKELDCGGV